MHKLSENTLELELKAKHFHLFNDPMNMTVENQSYKSLIDQLNDIGL